MYREPPFGQHRPVTLQVDHRHSARIVGIYRMIGERDAIAGWRESNVTDESGGLIENFPNRVLKTFEPSHAPNDGEIAAVRVPVGLADVFDHHARSAAQHRRSSERSLPHPAVIRVSEGNRELSGF